jgi:hypothetical protein
MNQEEETGEREFSVYFPSTKGFSVISFHNGVQSVLLVMNLWKKAYKAG